MTRFHINGNVAIKLQSILQMENRKWLNLVHVIFRFIRFMFLCMVTKKLQNKTNNISRVSDLRMDCLVVVKSDPKIYIFWLMIANQANIETCCTAKRP